VGGIGTAQNQPNSPLTETDPPRRILNIDRRILIVLALTAIEPFTTIDTASMSSLRELIQALNADPWRRDHAFSDDVEAAHRQLFATNDAEARAAALNEWLSKNQPCLFGKIAAKTGLMRYCIISDADLESGDEHVQRRIQTARSAWWADAFDGQASGFVIALISEAVAFCEPDGNVLSLARRLCELYLLHEIEPDHIYTDAVYLEKPGKSRRTWKWGVGANYFAAHGDGRWWRDHRILGGLAFSMNSVGHMVKAAVINGSMAQLDEKLGGKVEDWGVAHVDSLPKALILAMRTIANAANTDSGKATRLFDVSELPPHLACPIDLPPGLTDKNCCEYFGHYDTDMTLPSEYFRADVDRPADVQDHRLDFTYLFDKVAANTDFAQLGEGVVIRGRVETASANPRIRFALPDDVNVSDEPALEAALRGR
jgi:hypothetical protein